MSVSPARRKLSIGAGRVRVPPFWELEELLHSGLPLSGALDVMAARRSTPVLVASQHHELLGGRVALFVDRSGRLH